MNHVQLKNPGAVITYPANVPLSDVTHLAIGAHSDDLEIMAFHGISECYQSDHLWFGGVTVTNGVGSPQNEDVVLEREELRLTRQKEQNAAADLGNYAFMAQLDYESSEAKNVNEQLVQELLDLLLLTKPRVVYLHQPADKHPTHIGVLKASMAALRLLPEEDRPEAIYGCEVWRDLDWLPDEKKVYLETGKNVQLARHLLAVFESQISSGTDYVNGTLGRRVSNGTFANPHVVRRGDSFSLAIDLMPCVQRNISLADLILPEIEAFRTSVERGL